VHESIFIKFGKYKVDSPSSYKYNRSPVLLFLAVRPSVCHIGGSVNRKPSCR